MTVPTDPDAIPQGERDAAATRPALRSATQAREAESVAPPGAKPDAIPQRERKGLGTPNSLLSARPVAEPAEGKAGTLSSLDPRTNGLTRVIGSMGVVLTLVLLGAKLARRMGRTLGTAGRPSGVIEILARYPVTRNQHLLLLKLDRRILLLHRCGTAMTTLTEVSGEEEVASLLSRIEAGSREGLGTRFQGLLERFNSEHRTVSKAANASEFVWSPSNKQRLGAGRAESDRIETVDLTRGRFGRLGRGLFDRKGAAR